MVTTSRSLPAHKKVGINKFVLGFAAISASAIIGATGLAAAQTPNHGHPGAGYGGGNIVNLTINLKNSANNVINVVINIFK